MAKPKEDGDLGLRDLKKMMRALQPKLSCIIMTQDSLFSKYIGLSIFLIISPIIEEYTNNPTYENP